MGRRFYHFYVCDELGPASRWATREYLNLSAGFAGDDRGRGKHCVFFMAVSAIMGAPVWLRNMHEPRGDCDALSSLYE